MNELNGYIKVYRSFLQWEWHDDQSMVSVFIHCILLANWKSKRYHGTTIHRGSFVTSIANLASICGLAPNTVRRCLKRLQDTGELYVQSSNKGTVITVKNYSNYQSNDDSAVQNVSHDLHNNLHNNLHTTEEVKKERSIKKYIKKGKSEETLPHYYNANPIRNPEPVPATDEEVEQVRKMLMKGKGTEP